jgi:hypothetical protein
MARIVLSIVLVAMAAAVAAGPLFPSGSNAKTTWTGTLWSMDGKSGGNTICTPYASSFPASVSFAATWAKFYIPWASTPSGGLAVNTTQANSVWTVPIGTWVKAGNGGSLWGAGDALNTTVAVYNISETTYGPLTFDTLDFTVCTYTSHFGHKNIPNPGSGPSCDGTKKCWKAVGWKRSTDENAWFGVDDTYCHTYCNRALSQCSGAQELHIGSRPQCVNKCRNWFLPSTLGAFEPDMATAQVGYNSVQCRVGQLDAALTSGSCKGVNATSPVCVLPGTICDRYCDGLQGLCTGSASTFTIVQFKGTGGNFNKSACMEACAGYPMPANVPLSAAAFGTNTLQCRLAALGALTPPRIPDIEDHMNIFGKVFCKSAGKTGGAYCGPDKTIGWNGTYHEVTGHCTPGKALGGCCCNRGPLVVTKIGPNNLRLVVSLDGGPACAGNKNFDIPIFFIDDKEDEAYTQFSVSGIQVTVTAVLRKHKNEISVLNSIAPATCGSFACKNLNSEDCTVPLAPASTGVIEFSAAAAFSVSRLALLASALVALVAAKLF